MPGIKKSLKGEWSKIDKGKPPNSSPDGEMMSKLPPPKAPRPRNTSRKISRFLKTIGFMIFELF
jgi:hypothetical protein